MQDERRGIYVAQCTAIEKTPLAVKLYCMYGDIEPGATQSQ